MMHTALEFPRRRPLALLIASLTFAAGAAQAQTVAAPPQASTAAPMPPAQPAATVASGTPAPATTVVQAAPTSTTSPTSSDVQSVTIAAERPTSRIDRQVYDVRSDPGTANNSAADALSNVPSVVVDPDGTVTLRGNTNVQILVDGKPSAMLHGENRGAALNSMPADDIESVEVINNPGAQFGNEGGGGPILNLVMRRNRRPGGMGALNANVGSGGRYNSALSGSYNTGRLSLQGGVNFRHDGRDSTGQAQRERIDPATGVVTRSEQTSRSTGLNDSVGINGALGYNIGERDRISANFSYNKRSQDSRGDERYLTYGPDDGAQDNAVVSDLVSTNLRGGDSVNYGWGVQFDHKGDVTGELFKLDLRVSGTENDSSNRVSNVYAFSERGARNTQTRQANDNGNRIVDFTGDYELPLDKNLLKMGFKAAENEGTFDALYMNVDPLTGLETVNLARTNNFAVNEKNLAAYASYHWRLNETWGLLPGMRVEYTDIDIHQITTAVEAHNSYVSYIPSLFLNYKASDKNTIRLQYAHRIRRPNVNDLNPFIIYRDEFNVSSGNPRLAPTKSDSLELLFDSELGPFDANLRAFLRRESDLITERRSFINDTVLLTTRVNAGTNRAGGLEFQLNGKLLPNLSLNASGTLLAAEQENLYSSGEVRTRRATSLNLRARLRYQPRAGDTVQLTLNRQGRTLQGDGYRKANSTANLSWQHVLTPRLSLALNVTDLFDSNKQESIVDSDVLRSTSVRQASGRIAYVGLSYRFGGVTGAPQRGRDGMRRMDGQGGGMRGRGGPPMGGDAGGGGFHP